jgi:epoxide hydrolase-like predicted phosphatase
MSQQYQAIIFDFFDVIHSDPLKRWLSKYGLTEQDGFEEVNRLVDLGRIKEQEFHEQLSAISGQPLMEVEEVFQDTQLTDKSLVGLIEELHKNYKTGLLSNASSEYLRLILKEQDLVRLFDEIVVSAEIGLAKPSADIFHYILEKMAIEPETTIFIDDNIRNIEAAKALGITGLVYSDKEKLLEELSGLGIDIK